MKETRASFGPWARRAAALLVGLGALAFRFGSRNAARVGVEPRPPPLRPSPLPPPWRVRARATATGVPIAFHCHPSFPSADGPAPGLMDTFLGPAPWTPPLGGVLVAWSPLDPQRMSSVYGGPCAPPPPHWSGGAGPGSTPGATATTSLRATVCAPLSSLSYNTLYTPWFCHTPGDLPP